MNAYSSIHQCLQEITKWDDRSTSSKAGSLALQMESARVIYSICVINYITEKMQPLVKSLQKYSLNQIDALIKMKSLIANFEREQSSCAFSLFTKASDLASSIGAKFSLNRNLLTTGIQPRDQWASLIFLPAIEKLCQSLHDRTTQSSLNVCVISDVLDFSKDNVDYNQLVETFFNFSPGSNHEEKKANLSNERSLCKDQAKILPLIVFICYPSLQAMKHISLIIPASNASSERAFSKLTTILTDRRTSMGEVRLNDLAMISSNFKICPKVEEVIKRFISVAPRRINKFI